MIELVLPAARQAPGWEQFADMAEERLRRILAELSAGKQVWSAARLCAVCPQITGVSPVDTCEVTTAAGDWERRQEPRGMPGQLVLSESGLSASNDPTEKKVKLSGAPPESRRGRSASLRIRPA